MCYCRMSILLHVLLEALPKVTLKSSPVHIAKKIIDEIIKWYYLIVSAQFEEDLKKTLIYLLTFNNTTHSELNNNKHI